MLWIFNRYQHSALLFLAIYIKFRGAQAWAIKPTDCHAEATRLGHLDLAQRPL